MSNELKATDIEILPSANIEIEKHIEEIEFLTEEELIAKENEEEAEKALAPMSSKADDSKKHKPKISYAPLKNEKVKIDNYSAGELLAEISAAMMCQQFGIPDTETFENSVSYIDSWSKKIRDERALFIVSVSSKSWSCVEELVQSVEKELSKQEAEKCNEIAVQTKEGIITIFKNTDGDFEYNIYKQDTLSEKIRLMDGGILEYSEDGIRNVFDALSDLLEDYGIRDDEIKPVDIDDFESFMAGDIQYEDVVR